MRVLLVSLAAAVLLRGKLEGSLGGAPHVPLGGGPPGPAEKVAVLSATLAKLEDSPSASIAGPAKELHAAAEHALGEAPGPQRNDALRDVMSRSKAFLKQLSERSAELAKEEAVDRLSAQAVHLEPKVSPAARAALERAVEDRNGTELRLALHGAVADLQAKIDHLSTVSRNLTREISDDQVQSLLKLLRERRNLPLPTQLAVLRRKEYATLPEGKKLLANHTDAPLYDQLRALVPDAAEPDADVHHDSGVHSASRRVFVVSSRMKHAVAKLRSGLEKVRGELVTAVQEKHGTAADVKEGAEQLAALDKLLKQVDGTNDLAKQLAMLDSFAAQLAKLKR